MGRIIPKDRLSIFEETSQIVVYLLTSRTGISRSVIGLENLPESFSIPFSPSDYSRPEVNRACHRGMDPS